MPGAGYDLGDQVVEVLYDRGTSDQPEWSVGSGFVVQGGRVLTAAHNAGSDGRLLVRFRGAEEYEATIASLPGGGVALDACRDLAVLAFGDPVPDRARVRFARIEAHPQVTTPNLEGCWSIGFPRFQEKPRPGSDRPVRESARVDGYVPMGEGIVEGRPTLAVRRAPRELPSGDLGDSEWQGMSGAVVFAGPLVVGVVTEHHRPAGGQSLTMAPVALLEERPDARGWWELLGVEDPNTLLTVPVAVPGPLGEPWTFEAFLTSRRRHFTGREWLFDEITTWMRDGPGNARLLTGPPGSGKSAVFAEIVAGRCGPVLAYHCCIADTPATLDPIRFIRSIAAMVAANLPEFADRLSAGGDLAFRLTDAAVAADPASAFESALLEPLRSLPAPLEPQLLVVDALDEAWLASGTTKIPDLLGPRLARFPPWLRFLATSRPVYDVRVTLGSPPEFRIDEHPAENTDDLRRLVRRRLADGRVAPRVVEDGRPPDELGNAVVDAAAGSFLVVTMALDAVELGQMTLREIADLPPGVGAAYGMFFARLYPDPASYGPARTVLEAIVAAQEPPTRVQLGMITRLDDETELPPILQRLAAFVPARDGRYAPFHRTLTEWLSDFDPQTDLPRAGAFAISIRRGHDRLSDWSLQAAPPAYRIRHLVTHLVGARRYDELAAAVTDWRWLCEIVEGRYEAGTTSFDVVSKLRDALGALPPENPQRAVVVLLTAAVRADAHFLSRHPGLWFQSCWNRGWWVDAPSVVSAFSDQKPPSDPSGERLSTLVERWRTERPGGQWWLRARWPFPDTGLPILARIADLDSSTSAVALSPDGTILCSGDESGVRTWDPLSGAPVASHAIEDDYVTDLAFTSPDEVVAGTGNGSILALNVADLSLLRAGGPLGERVHVAALAGGRVAVATHKGQLKIWDTATGDWLESASPGGSISAMAASPDGSELFVGTDGYGQTGVRRFRVGHLQEGATWERDTSSDIMAVGWSGDGRTLAWTEYDGALVICAESSPEKRVRMPDGAKAWALTFADSDRAVACNTAEELSRLLIVDIATEETRVMVPSHRGTAYSLSADAKRRYLASGGSEEIRVWDVVDLLAGNHRIARSVMPDVARFLPDGRLLVAAEDHDVVHVLNLEAAAVERELPGHSGGVRSLAIARDGRFACATGDGPVLLWDPGTWTSQVVTQHDGEAGAVAFSDDGARMATGGDDGTVRLLDLALGAEVASLSLGNWVVTDVAIAPDGEHLAVATYGSFSILSVADQAAQTVDVEATTYGLAFTADGRQVVYVAPGAMVLAANSQTGAEVPPTAEHEAAYLASLGCRDPRWAWRSPRGRRQRRTTALEMPLVELATDREVAWFPLVWATATPDVTGRTWALVTRKELYVLTLEDV